MTLLSICQTVADETGFPQPSSIVGNTSDSTAVRLLAAAQRAGKRLARRPFAVLQKEHSFSTVASTASYSLPSDFGWMLDRTAWNQTDYRGIRGSQSPARWQFLKSGITTTNQFNPKYRIKASSGSRLFFIDPTPDSADTVVFEYISDQWCQDASSTAQNAWAADDDTGIIDEELLELETKWRFLRAIGLAYDEEILEARQAVDHYIATEKGAERLNLAGETFIIGAANIQDADFPSS